MITCIYNLQKMENLPLQQNQPSNNNSASPKLPLVDNSTLLYTNRQKHYLGQSSFKENKQVLGQYVISYNFDNNGNSGFTRNILLGWDQQPTKILRKKVTKPNCSKTPIRRKILETGKNINEGSNMIVHKNSTINSPDKTSSNFAKSMSKLKAQSLQTKKNNRILPDSISGHHRIQISKKQNNFQSLKGSKHNDKFHKTSQQKQNMKKYEFVGEKLLKHSSDNKLNAKRFQFTNGKIIGKHNQNGLNPHKNGHFRKQIFNRHPQILHDRLQQSQINQLQEQNSEKHGMQTLKLIEQLQKFEKGSQFLNEASIKYKNQQQITDNEDFTNIAKPICHMNNQNRKIKFNTSYQANDKNSINQCPKKYMKTEEANKLSQRNNISARYNQNKIRNQSNIIKKPFNGIQIAQRMTKKQHNSFEGKVSYHEKRPLNNHEKRLQNKDIKKQQNVNKKQHINNNMDRNRQMERISQQGSINNRILMNKDKDKRKQDQTNDRNKEKVHKQKQEIKELKQKQSNRQKKYQTNQRNKQKVSNTNKQKVCNKIRENTKTRKQSNYKEKNKKQNQQIRVNKNNKHHKQLKKTDRIKKCDQQHQQINSNDRSLSEQQQFNIYQPQSYANHINIHQNVQQKALSPQKVSINHRQCSDNAQDKNNANQNQVQESKQTQQYNNSQKRLQKDKYNIQNELKLNTYKIQQAEQVNRKKSINKQVSCNIMKSDRIGYNTNSHQPNYKNYNSNNHTNKKPGKIINKKSQQFNKTNDMIKNSKDNDSNINNSRYSNSNQNNNCYSNNNQNINNNNSIQDDGANQIEHNNSNREQRKENKRAQKYGQERSIRQKTIRNQQIKNNNIYDMNKNRVRQKQQQKQLVQQQKQLGQQQKLLIEQQKQIVEQQIQKLNNNLQAQIENDRSYLQQKKTDSKIIGEDIDMQQKQKHIKNIQQKDKIRINQLESNINIDNDNEIRQCVNTKEQQIKTKKQQNKTKKQQNKTKIKQQELFVGNNIRQNQQANDHSNNKQVFIQNNINRVFQSDEIKQLSKNNNINNVDIDNQYNSINSKYQTKKQQNNKQIDTNINKPIDHNIDNPITNTKTNNQKSQSIKKYHKKLQNQHKQQPIQNNHKNLQSNLTNTSHNIRVSQSSGRSSLTPTVITCKIKQQYQMDDLNLLKQVSSSEHTSQDQQQKHTQNNNISNLNNKLPNNRDDRKRQKVINNLKKPINSIANQKKTENEEDWANISCQAQLEPIQQQSIFQDVKHNQKLNQTDLLSSPKNQRKFIKQQRILNKDNALHDLNQELRSRDNYERAPVLSLIYGQSKKQIQNSTKYQPSLQLTNLEQINSEEFDFQKNIKELSCQTMECLNLMKKILMVIISIDPWLIDRIIQPFISKNKNNQGWLYCQGIWRPFSDSENTNIFVFIYKIVKQAAKQYYQIDKNFIQRLGVEQVIRMITGLRVMKLKNRKKLFQQLNFNLKKGHIIKGIWDDPNIQTIYEITDMRYQNKGSQTGQKLFQIYKSGLQRPYSNKILQTEINIQANTNRAHTIHTESSNTMFAKKHSNYNWIKQENLNKFFDYFLLIAYRPESFWTSSKLDNQAGYVSVYTLDSIEQVSGSLEIHSRYNCSVKIDFYREIKPNVLKMVGKLNQKNRNNGLRNKQSPNPSLYFDFTIKGRYYLFIQYSSSNDSKQESVHFSFESSKSLIINYLQKIKKDSLRNDHSQYVSVHNKSSSKSKTKSILSNHESNLKEQFINYLMSTNKNNQ